MSEAREKYLKNSGTYDCESFGCQAEDYIKELEQQKAELMEFIEDIVDYEAERVLMEREILLNKYK